MKTIRVAEGFSMFPGGRYRTDGNFSGERFREEWLKPALNSHDAVQVVLDGTAGYGSSFLEEAFGGAVRDGYIQPSDLGNRLVITAETPLYETYKRQVERYVTNAARQAA